MSGGSFYVGQKVVCVDATNADALTQGAIYTIKYLGFWPAQSGLDGEIVSCGVGLFEAESVGLGFDARRFKPVVERKTDISIFTDMLIEQKKPVAA